MKELTDSDKQYVKGKFNAWLEVMESKKELTTEATNLKKDAAEVFDVKPARIGALFASMKKRLDLEADEQSDIDELYEMAEELGI